MRNNCRNGFTAVEVMVAMLIIALLVLATGQLLVTLQTFMKKSQQSSNRVLSLYQLTDQVTRREAFAESMVMTPDNDKLRTCVVGGSLGACASNCCAANTAEEFILVDLDDPNPNLLSRRRILGTAAKPAYYTQDGKPCDPNTQKCFYKVTGTFSPRCPANLLTCDKAEILVLNLKVQPLDATTQVKERSLTIHYTPASNAKPTLVAIANQIITVGGQVTVPVNGNSGHPQEKQNLFFSQCTSSNPAIARVRCFGFINDIGNILVEGLTQGTATINIQINDGAAENNLSDVNSFQVDVTP